MTDRPTDANIAKQARLQKVVDHLCGKAELDMPVHAVISEHIHTGGGLVQAENLEAFYLARKEPVPAGAPQSGICLLASEILPEEIWPGMVAHELGHVMNGDIDRKLTTSAPARVLKRLLPYLLALPFVALAIHLLTRGDSFVDIYLANTIAMLSWLSITLALNLSKHRIERRADKRACELIGGKAYAHALSYMASVGHAQMRLFDALGQHPSIESRIERALGHD